MVSFETGLGALIKKAANLVQECWLMQEIFNHARDKIIIYCWTREEVAQLAEIFYCSTYISKLGTEEEKAAIIAGWLSNRD